MRISRFALAFLTLFALPGAALPQAYPSKPVHVVISFPPGSSTDIVGRIVMHKVSELWGQPVVPENRSGAGGSIGSAAVARAAPDDLSPAEFAKFVRDEIATYQRIITAAGIKPQ